MKLAGSSLKLELGDHSLYELTNQTSSEWRLEGKVGSRHVAIFVFQQTAQTKSVTPPKAGIWKHPDFCDTQMENIFDNLSRLRTQRHLQRSITDFVHPEFWPDATKFSATAQPMNSACLYFASLLDAKFARKYDYCRFYFFPHVGMFTKWKTELKEPRHMMILGFVSGSQSHMLTMKIHETNYCGNENCAAIVLYGQTFCRTCECANRPNPTFRKPSRGSKSSILEQLATPTPNQTSFSEQKHTEDMELAIALSLSCEPPTKEAKIQTHIQKQIEFEVFQHDYKMDVKERYLLGELMKALSQIEENRKLCAAEFPRFDALQFVKPHVPETVQREIDGVTLCYRIHCHYSKADWPTLETYLCHLSKSDVSLISEMVHRAKFNS